MERVNMRAVKYITAGRHVLHNNATTMHIVRSVCAKSRQKQSKPKLLTSNEEYERAGITKTREKIGVRFTSEEMKLET